MEKRVTTAFGKKVYLLGTDKKGILYWLEEGKWECKWYWGIGYVETYTNNKKPHLAKDIRSHQHFNGLFFNGPSNGFDEFKNFFADTPLSDKEIWQLMEIMNSLYTLRNYSDMLHRGGARYTTNPCSDIIKNDEEYERINKIVIPALSEQLYKLLGEEKTQ